MDADLQVSRKELTNSKDSFQELLQNSRNIFDQEIVLLKDQYAVDLKFAISKHCSLLESRLRERELEVSQLDATCESLSSELRMWKSKCESFEEEMEKLQLSKQMKESTKLARQTASVFNDNLSTYQDSKTSRLSASDLLVSSEIVTSKNGSISRSYISASSSYSPRGLAHQMEESKSPSPSPSPRPFTSPSPSPAQSQLSRSEGLGTVERFSRSNQLLDSKLKGKGWVL